MQSQSTEFAYNAEAQRIGKTVSVTSTVNGQTQTDTASLRHYNNGTAIVADGVTRGTTTELNSYIFGKESEPGYAQFEALYDGTTLYFAEVDSHTDITELVGANGQTASYSYDAYGNATSAISGGVYNPYRYTSQYLDEETGLYYLRARYYDPSNGRFTQEDSYLGEENNPLTLNLYMYCHGNPLMFRDLSGNKAKDGNMGIINGANLPWGSYSSHTIQNANNVTWAVTSSFNTITKNHCAATAVTNLALYFYKRGYKNLMVDTRRGRSAYETFRAVHKIVGNGPVMAIANKTKKYFKNRGYSLKSSGAHTYTAVQKAIDKNRPVGVLITDGLFSWHWIICIGYRKYSNGNFYMQIVDGWNNTINKYYKPHSGSAWISGTQYWI